MKILRLFVLVLLWGRTVLLSHRADYDVYCRSLPLDCPPTDVRSDQTVRGKRMSESQVLWDRTGLLERSYVDKRPNPVIYYGSTIQLALNLWPP